MLTAKYFFAWLFNNYSMSTSGIIVFLNTPPKNKELDYNENKKAQKNHAYARHFCRSWYNGSYTMMAKPMKSLELHYQMIQFLIIPIIHIPFLLAFLNITVKLPVKTAEVAASCTPL